MEVFSVSQSKLKAWRQCHYKYYLKHVRKLQRKKRPRPLIRGTIMHDMQEAKIEGLDPWKVFESAMKKNRKMFKEEIEEFGNLPEEIKALMEGYWKYYKPEPLKYIKHGGKKSEWPFEVELPGTSGIILKGRLDSAARTKDKRVWLVEHKCHKTLPTNEFKFTDIQSVLYAWAMPIFGLPEPDGVCWDYTRAKAPTIPNVLKSGELSRSEKIDTTWTVYLQAIKDNDLKPKDYADMKAVLEGKEEDFYKRVFLPLSKAVTENMLEETVTTAKEIRRRAGKDNTRTIAQHCGWCEFSDGCRAEFTGLDADYIWKHNFEESDYDKKDDKKKKAKKR